MTNNFVPNKDLSKVSVLVYQEDNDVSEDVTSNQMPAMYEINLSKTNRLSQLF